MNLSILTVCGPVIFLTHVNLRRHVLQGNSERLSVAFNTKVCSYCHCSYYGVIVGGVCHKFGNPKVCDLHARLAIEQNILRLSNMEKVANHSTNESVRSYLYVSMNDIECMQVLYPVNHVHEERQEITLTKLPFVGFVPGHQVSQRAILAILENEVPVLLCLEEPHKLHDAGMTNLRQNVEFRFDRLE